MAGKKKGAKENLGLELALKAITDEFGADSLFCAGDSGRVLDVPKLSSGSLKLDIGLGGGYGEGRVIEVLGPESAGKTTLMLHAIKEAQKKGKLCAFIDAEHALDLRYAEGLGVDIDSLLVSQPGCAEEALKILDKLARTGAVGLVAIDSVAALVPKAELDGEVGDAHVGLQARLMSQTLRMITGIAQKTGTTIFFSNQIRMKIGVLYGNPETTSGGNALKFYASQRLDVRKISTNVGGSDGQAVSNRVRIKIIKNKLAPPYREVETDIEFGRGFNIQAEVLDLGIEMGFVEVSGSWLTLGGKRAQGRAQAIALLQAEPELYETLSIAVRAKIFGETEALKEGE